MVCSLLRQDISYFLTAYPYMIKGKKCKLKNICVFVLYTGKQ